MSSISIDPWPYQLWGVLTPVALSHSLVTELPSHSVPVCFRQTLCAVCLTLCAVCLSAAVIMSWRPGSSWDVQWQASTGRALKTPWEIWSWLKVCSTTIPACLKCPTWAGWPRSWGRGSKVWSRGLDWGYREVQLKYYQFTSLIALDPSATIGPLELVSLLASVQITILWYY